MNVTQKNDRKLDAENLAEIELDFFNAVEAAAVNARSQIAQLINVQPTSSSASYKLQDITWEPTNGPNGPYEKSVGQPRDHPALNALLEDLKQHGGKIIRDGFFVWSFQRGDAVGRKVRSEK